MSGQGRAVSSDKSSSDKSSSGKSSSDESFVAAVDADRLDKALVSFLAEREGAPSRAEVRRWIDAARVAIDGRVVTAAAARVRAGATVQVRIPPPPPSLATPDASVEYAVLFEDEHLLVIDKPAGLVVHPARGHASGTLVNGLLARPGFGARLGTREGEQGEDDGETSDGVARPGIVHRLDKGTSGLLVVAKDPFTREGLKALFSKHDIDREYVAVVIGAPAGGTISTLHGRHPTDRLRFTSTGRLPKGKRAVTHVTVLERLGPASLVACRLETGRTHQLRVHLSEQSRTPILGDPIYGSRPHDPWLAELADGLGHQALHARVLGFVHPRTKKTLRFESPLPADVSRVVEALRQRAAEEPTRPLPSR